MLNVPAKSRAHGFTIIELMVGVVVIGILMSFAVPSFRIWMQNAQIRNAAESVKIGLQRARSEAVTRNANVEFILAPDTSWEIQLAADGTIIDSRLSSEGSSHISAVVLPIGAIDAMDDNKATVTFNNFGGIAGNINLLLPIDQVNFTSSQATNAELSNLTIVLGVGGNARMCDPTATSGQRQC